MDTLLAIAIGLYVLFESFTALNEMHKVSAWKFFSELKNPYAVKYWVAGLSGLLLIYYSQEIGWFFLLGLVPMTIVMGRTLYRLNPPHVNN